MGAARSCWGAAGELLGSYWGAAGELLGRVAAAGTGGGLQVLDGGCSRYWRGAAEAGVHWCTQCTVLGLGLWLGSELGSGSGLGLGEKIVNDLEIQLGSTVL